MNTKGRTKRILISTRIYPETKAKMEMLANTMDCSSTDVIVKLINAAAGLTVTEASELSYIADIVENHNSLAKLLHKLKQ